MYCVGDKVVVREDLQWDHRYKMFSNILTDIVTAEMLSYRGKVVTISRADRKYKIEGDGHWWTDEMFEGYADDIVVNVTDEEFETLFNELMCG